MAGKHTVLSIPVQLDTAMFRDFAAFDVLKRQKRWQRPLVFAVLMVAFAVICFTQVGVREGAAMVGTVLAVVGVGLPLIYFFMFFRSVNQQARKMGLTTPKDVYRVVLDEDGVRMWPAGQQDKEEAAVRHPWDQIYAAWKTPGAIYLYINAAQAYLLPADQIPGGMEACWALLQTQLPATKLHTHS